MIIVLKRNCDERQVKKLVEWVESKGLHVNMCHGTHSTVLAVLGDTEKIDVESVRATDIVESVKRIQDAYKLTNRKFHSEDTVIRVGDAVLGGGRFAVVAGPCSVESEEQIIGIAEAVKAAGATLLRGGAFKPRTSPYAFQGLRADGLELLLKAKRAVGLPIVSEIMGVEQLELFDEVDVLQIGARNMQNYELLKKVGQLKKPILLKRGFANTVEEWFLSAEYIMAEGNGEVILCERGIRTFEPYTRNTLDLSAIPLLKERTHLPVIVDPSHASGLARLVKPLSLASVGASADGLMIEVHNDPPRALCDGAQSVRPEQFADIMNSVRQMLPLVGKSME